MKILSQSVKLESVTENPERLIEKHGRICWGSHDKMTENSAPEFISKLIRLGHHSVIEHASASFKIVADRAICMEIVRHRIASFSMSSTRYIRYTDDVPFIEPPDLNKEQRIEWMESCVFSEKQYKKLLSMGCSPQIARSVLPNCTAAELAMTANLREWLHFIELRGSKAAHPQIRPIAHEINRILAEYAPSVFIVKADDE